MLYEQHYEGGQYLLVNDQDGRQTVVGAVPNFSRSGNRAIVCLVSVYDGFEVQVWKRDGSGWVKEWAESPFFDFYTEYKFLRWTSEMSADLEAIIVDERNTQSRRIQPLTLTLRNEKWTILPASNSATGRF